jgi:hypothetical protein
LNLPNLKPFLLSLSLLLITSGNAFISYQAQGAFSYTEEHLHNPGRIESQSLQSLSIPAVDSTQVVNLPLIEQNAPTAAQTPASPGEILLGEGSTFTETPVANVPLSLQQIGSTNLPIILGAMVIVAVIVFTWIVIGPRSLD